MYISVIRDTVTQKDSERTYVGIYRKYLSTSGSKVPSSDDHVGGVKLSFLLLLGSALRLIEHHSDRVPLYDSAASQAGGSSVLAGLKVSAVLFVLRSTQGQESNRLAYESI